MWAELTFVCSSDVNMFAMLTGNLPFISSYSGVNMFAILTGNLPFIIFL